MKQPIIHIAEAFDQRFPDKIIQSIDFSDEEIIVVAIDDETFTMHITSDDDCYNFQSDKGTEFSFPFPEDD